RETFQGVCATCHGLSGQGDIGPPIPTSPLLADRGAMTLLLRNGRNRMPAVGKTWTDAQLSATLDYLQERFHAGGGSSGRSRAAPARVAAGGLVCRGRYASWLATVDHKRIGIMYIATSLAFFVVGGILALLMRAQLATPNEHFIRRGSYNELFTIHGTTMVFL